MNRTFTLLLAFLLCSLAAVSQTEVVPSAYATSAGTASFTGPFSSAGRTYQLLINQTMLTNLLGQELTGLTFRASAGGTGSWPASTATVTNYDIYIGPGVAPASRDLTNINNNAIGTQTQVRSGSMTFPAGSVTLGSTPNAWGPVIMFTTPYMYTGGNILVEIRHSGAGSNRAIDALSTSTAGYGTDFSAAWAGTYSGATTGMQGNFGIVQFTYQTPLSIQLQDFFARLDGVDARLNWFTASEKNNDHFVIQRSFNGSDFQSIASVPAIGNSAEPHEYEFIDKAIKKHNTAIAYYRLQYVDKAGSIGYSRVQSVTLRSVGAGITFYPNPVSETANVGITVSTAGEMGYNIIDAIGRTVRSGSILVNKGFNPVSLDVASFAAGSYMLLLKGENTNESVRFSKN